MKKLLIVDNHPVFLKFLISDVLAKKQVFFIKSGQALNIFPFFPSKQIITGKTDNYSEN